MKTDGRQNAAANFPPPALVPQTGETSEGDVRTVPQQGEFVFPPAGAPASGPMVPARMVNEYQYCPRLAYLEWVQGEWAESADTVEGRHAHRRVNRDGGTMPAPHEVAEKLHARSVTLSSERLGLIARMDLIESEQERVVPVDYKRGKRPHVKGGAYDPERVQLCVQGLILREHGYRCDEGVLYFVAGRERVRVVFDDELIAATERAVEGLRSVAQGGTIPPPLEDSPKCPRCSLVSICLPDEVNHLALLSRHGTAPRPIAVPATDALPLYVQARGAKVAKSGETLVVTVDDEKLATARLAETSQVVLMGSIYVTAPCLQELMWRGIPVTWHSHGGWFYGSHRGEWAQERGAQNGSISGQLRPRHLSALREGAGEREDSELPDSAQEKLEAVRSQSRRADRAQGGQPAGGKGAVAWPCCSASKERLQLATFERSRQCSARASRRGRWRSTSGSAIDGHRPILSTRCSRSPTRC